MRRVLLCSGKVYWDLVTAMEKLDSALSRATAVEERLETLFDWKELEQRQHDLVDRIKDSPYMDDPEVAQMVERVDEILDEYEE